MKTYKPLVWLGIVAALLAGCGKTSDKITSAERTVNGNSVSLAETSFELPEGWKVFDMTKEDFAKAMDDWVASNPQAKQIVQGVKAMARNKAIRLFALDPVHSEPGFADNLNVLVLEQAVPANLDALLTQSQKQLATLPGTTAVAPFKREMVGANEFVHGQFNMNAPQGLQLIADSYGALRHGKSITFTFTCLAPHAADFTETARATMESVQLK